MNDTKEKQPTYRPYRNSEEFLKASKEHGPWINNINPIKCDRQGIFFVDNNIYMRPEIVYLSFVDIYNYNWVWQDGTSCGILI